MGAVGRLSHEYERYQRYRKDRKLQHCTAIETRDMHDWLIDYITDLEFRDFLTKLSADRWDIQHLNDDC